MNLPGLLAAVIGAMLLFHGAGQAVVYAQTAAVRAAAAQNDDARIRTLLDRVEQAVHGGDPDVYLGFVSLTADRTRATDFAAIEVRPGVTRAVIIERDRQHLTGTLPGNGYRLMVDVFIEYGNRARIGTWQLDLRKTDDVEWRIADQERLSSVDNLYRLAVNTTRQFDARNFTVTSEDLRLTLAEGSVFTVDTDQGVTGLVLLGRGEMQFEPTPETEKGQVRIFAGAATLQSRFDAAYVRVGELKLHADPSQLMPRAVDSRELRRAEQVFREESPKAYALELGDLTPEMWSLSPGYGDFLAEVRTRRFDTLTYSRSRPEAEDISLFDRRRHRNIAVYASADKLATRGRFYNEDDLAAYDVLDYEIDLAVAPTPDRQFMEGRATLRLRMLSAYAGQLTLRLAEPLIVHSVVSKEFGRLFSLRVRNQNTVLVSLPVPVPRDTELSLTVVYSGRLAPQTPDRETVAIQQPRDNDNRNRVEVPLIRGESTYLYSNRSYWYPQAPITDYATATMRITVPASLACIGSGEPGVESPTLVPPKGGIPARKIYVFNANRPVRYLAIAISRFVRADRVTVAFDEPDERAGNGPTPSLPSMSGAVYDTLDLVVEAHPLQLQRARALVDRVADVAQYYRALIGDSPYQSFTLALVENELPGGHSPGYFAALNQPLPNTPLVWRTDPANFEGFPEFFLAHELAHQWWGQAVGWRNYHEQWLSEGFAQYFAALYAQHHRGDETFTAVLRQLRKWAMAESDQGPVYLGYRLGHIRNDSRVFRALVYNKGAAVLHMLRRLVGDEVFFRGIRRFYVGARYLKVGTEDFRTAMEAEAGRSLENFFERWIYGSTLPNVTFSHRIESTPTGQQEVVLHFEQADDIFEIPVTVTLQYSDRRSVEVLVPLTDRIVDMRVPLTGALRTVNISNDDGTLADIRKLN
jgi:hypothetical protein